MEKLTTLEELKQLYDKKGKEALVWYTWRNTLRTSSLLGIKSLRQTWPSNTIKNIFATLRIPLILSNFLTNKSSINYISFIDAITYANDTSNSTYASAYIDAAIQTIYTANATSALNSSSAAFKAYTYAYPSNAYADYKFLKKTNLTSKNYWLTQKLCLAEETTLTKKRQDINHFRRNSNQLIKELIDLGLSFIATDLQKVWFSKLELTHLEQEPHWQNYAKTFSESDFINADTLHEAILGETRTIHAVRVLLLGPGGAGKTTLAQRLHNQPVEKYCETTLGINYFNHKPLKLFGKTSAFQNIKVEDELKLYLWDFAGQTLFYGMHRSFLHENCVYVLVVDSRHEQTPDHWLQHIYHLAGKDNRPPILVVINEYENCHNPQNQTRLQRLFGKDNLQFFHFNCQNPEAIGLQGFKQALLDVAKHSRHSTSTRLFDASDYLKTLFAEQAVWDISDLEDKLTPFTTASINLDTTLTQLEHLGRIVNLIDAQASHEVRFCLNPTWVVDHAYQLLNLAIIKDKQGVIKKSELRRAVKQEFHDLKEHFNDLMHFLQNSRVCKILGNSYFFPDMTTPNEPLLVHDLLNDYKSPLIVEFHLPYIPIGLAAHLVCYWLDGDEEEVARIQEPQEVWREGFILRHKHRAESLLIIEYHYGKSLLFAYCIGEKSNELLQPFWRSLLREIQPKIKKEKVLCFKRIDEQVFTFDPDSNIEISKPDTNGTPVTIGKLENCPVTIAANNSDQKTHYS